MVIQKLKIGVTMIKPYNNIVDMSDKPCIDGCGGVYREASILDDLYGDLHCTVCNKRVDRYIAIPESGKES